uniref:ANTAR domain-containing protein n=1 Tax=Streptomyces sp. NBC_00148 TaxID=2903626 RepID=A0AAU1M0I8_9ACTN
MFMQGGDTIRALKVVVDATGYDLRQARDIVYALVYDLEVPRTG